MIERHPTLNAREVFLRTMSDWPLFRIKEAKGTPLEHALFRTEQAARDAWNAFNEGLKHES